MPERVCVGCSFIYLSVWCSQMVRVISNVQSSERSDTLAQSVADKADGIVPAPSHRRAASSPQEGAPLRLPGEGSRRLPSNNKL